MKILIFSQYFWPENFLINDFALELVKKNKVDVITGMPNYPQGYIYDGYNDYDKKKFEIYKKINIYRCKIIPRKKSRFYDLIINYISFLFFSFIKLFFLKSKKKNYDLCIVYAPSPLISLLPIFILKKKFNLKIYLWVQDLWPEVIDNKINFKFLKLIISKVCKYIYKNSDFLLLQSKDYNKYLISKYKINENKLIYFPNWSNNYEQIKYEPNQNKKVKVGYFGNIGYAQNFNNLCDILKSDNLDEFEFHFYGEGRYKSHFLNVINKFDLKNIFFHKFKKISELKKILVNFDALFLSLSSEYKHTTPAKFQFYLSLGLPIMAIIDGNTKEIINKNNVGFACSEHEKDLFIKKARKFSKDSIENKKVIANNAYKLYQNNFSKKIIINKFYELIKYENNS